MENLINLLQSEVKSFEPRVQFQDVGTVQHIGSGVATLSGLHVVCTDELVVFPNGVKGLVLNLGEEKVDVILLGSAEDIRGGDLVTSTGKRLEVPVGPKMLGRVVNSLGVPLDDLGPIRAGAYSYLEQDAPGIVDRSPVNQPLQTGTKIIDALIPLGRGQRELIVGDRQTGKTTLAVDAILNQKGSAVDCIYVSIGQKKSSTLAVIEKLQSEGAMEYTTIVMASPDDPPALRYLAPFAGCSMAEHFLKMGRDVLIVYDDLSKHADAYRELSLLLRRPPGREAYPGDIFYLHSRLLERACKLKTKLGGGSITALPIVSIQRGNISAYIPTNLISITDGQIILNADLFNLGMKPAIDIGRSVSRVGGAAQTKAMRTVSGDLRLELSQYNEVVRFAKFGTEVDQATKRQIERGKRLQLALTQDAHEPLPLVDQIIVLFSAVEGYLDRIEFSEIVRFQQDLRNTMHDEHFPTLLRISREEQLNKEITNDLHEILKEYCEKWMEREK
ncbi:MAG: F0F1 ATP synthase subunit alpha [Anaerolineaceae bacterium]|nr:F0F1 ATP synthase subunit alpha [Anaerolineaceae bacterium]